MVADLGDGVVARWLHHDDLRRRALDSVVDRVAIDSCLIGATVCGALPLALLVPFLGRDAYCAAVCIRMVRQNGIAIKADIMYRGLNFSVAAWALSAPLLPSSSRIAIATGILVASLIVAADLTRCVRVVRSASIETQEQVLAPRVLRKLSGTRGTQLAPGLAKPHTVSRSLAA
jgi:phosphatidylglycerophosphate synthase